MKVYVANLLIYFFPQVMGLLLIDMFIYPNFITFINNLRWQTYLMLLPPPVFLTTISWIVKYPVGICPECKVSCGYLSFNTEISACCFFLPRILI